jgi:5-methyltetrahydropteroyltriglutamate--homocysteine methyltransferase
MTASAKTFLHADHVGSMLRPQKLKDAARAFFGKRMEAAEFKRITDECVLEAIRLQEEAGMKSITDGEFRRASWFDGFIQAVEGIGVKPALFSFTDDAGKVVDYQTAWIEGKLRRRRGITTGEFEFLKANTSQRPKITIPAPSLVHFFRGDESVNREAYPNLDDFWSDLIGIYKAEVKELAALGLTFLQLDEVAAAVLCDPKMREQAKNLGLDPDAMLEKYIWGINEIAGAAPDTMQVGVHVCRGNYKGHWMASGGYEAVAAKFFPDTKVDVFFLEYDSERAGGFEPLRHMRDDTCCVLGLVTSKAPQLEDKELLKQRIGEAAKFMDKARLGISPQCGFASSVGGNPLTIEDEKAKLRLVAEVAQEVWS